jgi:general stress protein 26
VTASENPRQHLFELLKKFDTAMLITHAPDGQWHGRPLAIASIEDSGEMYFSTSLASPKVKELATDGQAMVTLQSSGRFVTIQGVTEIVRDRSEIDRLWSEAWRVWFPGGKTDPSLCLIRLHPRHAEYWDRAGAKGLALAFESVIAVAKGVTPKLGKDVNAKVELRPFRDAFSPAGPPARPRARPALAPTAGSISATAGASPSPKRR